MAFFKERMRLQTVSEAEAAGENFWSPELDSPVKMKLAHLFEALDGLLRDWGEDGWREAAARLARDEGIPVPNLGPAFIAQSTDSEVVLSCIEIFYSIVEDKLNSAYHESYEEQFVKGVNAIFDAHRIDFQMTDSGQIIPRKSQELHAETVLRPLRLLHSNPELDKAERSYLDALAEIADRNPADAITDAGRALQETLAVLGCEGNVLGEQIKSARRKQLLAGRDAPLSEAIEKTMNWVASERNQNSDAHPATDTQLDDAWFIVHIVGALIVRLVGPPRG